MAKQKYPYEFNDSIWTSNPYNANRIAYIRIQDPYLLLVMPL